MFTKTKFKKPIESISFLRLVKKMTVVFNLHTQVHQEENNF